MSKPSPLRNLPSVDEVLRSAGLSDLRDRYSPRRLTQWVRQAVDECRHQVLQGDSLDPRDAVAKVIECVRQIQQDDHGQALQAVINATGVILHTNLGRAPLADRAIERLRQATGYTNVELDLRSGRRAKRGQRVMELLAAATGAEAAVVVNNCAAATVLVLQAIAGQREVILSRGQLVEIGGGFRLPDVFRTAGVTLREIGTTNRTYLHDYQSAINDATGAILRVHRSNFSQHGFVCEPSIEDLASLPRDEDVALIDDLGSGCMTDLSSLGFHEPTVQQSVRSGADVTLFSGDKLFGGPQAGIVVGRRRWIERLSGHPLMRAMRVDKLTLAALEATAEIHLEDRAVESLPVMQMLMTESPAIAQRCQQVHEKLGTPSNVQVVPCQSTVGGGSLPGATLDSYGLKWITDHPDESAAKLRQGSPAIQPRVVDDGVLLDLRTVLHRQTKSLVDRLSTVLAEHDESDGNA